jgi:hypothetical protein
VTPSARIAFANVVIPTNVPLPPKTFMGVDVMKRIRMGLGMHSDLRLSLLHPN